MTKPYVATPIPKSEMPMLAVAAASVHMRGRSKNRQQQNLLQISRPILKLDDKNQECSPPSHPPKLLLQNQKVESLEMYAPWRIEQKPPVDGPIEVIISEFTTRFYLRYCCHEDSLKELMKKVQILGPQAKPVNTLKNNLTCLFSNGTGAWYRVRIIYVSDGRPVLCRSLDYGKIFLVPKEKQQYFRIMEKSLKMIPSFAICVELNVEIKTRKIGKPEKQKLIGKKYLMDIVRDGNIKLVKLKSFDGENLALKLSKIGFSNLRR